MLDGVRFTALSTPARVCGVPYAAATRDALDVCTLAECTAKAGPVAKTSDAAARSTPIALTIRFKAGSSPAEAERTYFHGIHRCPICK